MKNLNLNKYGVQEMNTEEMVNVNGGTLGEVLASIWNWLVGHSDNGKVAIKL